MRLAPSASFCFINEADFSGELSVCSLYFFKHLKVLLLRLRKRNFLNASHGNIKFIQQLYYGSLDFSSILSNFYEICSIAQKRVKHHACSYAFFETTPKSHLFLDFSHNNANILALFSKPAWCNLFCTNFYYIIMKRIFLEMIFKNLLTNRKSFAIML